MKVEDLKEIIDENGQILDAGSPKGKLQWTTLQFACAVNDIDLVQEILSEDPSAFLNTGNTKHSPSPLHIAVYYGHQEIVEKLLQNYDIVTIRKSTTTNISPLHIAIIQENINLIRILLDAGMPQTSLHNVVKPIDLASSLNLRDIEQLLQDNERRSNSRLKLSTWLASIGLIIYFEAFCEAGYDDPEFLLSNGLPEEALTNMNILKPGHRQKLQSLYQLDEILHNHNEEREGTESQGTGSQVSESEEAESDTLSQ